MRTSQPRARNPSTHAVWVYCEDQARCKDNYKSCWLKHLVRDGQLTQLMGVGAMS